MKSLIVDEGCTAVINKRSERIEVNIPKSIREIEGYSVPRVTILPPAFKRLLHFSGVEYLQANVEAEIRYPWDDGLKHFVLLGDELPYDVHRFEHVPDGCVVHVESETMAEKVLEQVNAEKIYVIPDAEEWRDFPDEKVAMTMEEYNPEGRLTEKQKELRLAIEAKRAEEEIKKLEKLRQEGKARSIRKMVEPVIMPVLESLLGPQESVVDWRRQETRYKYSIDVTEGKSIEETFIEVRAKVIGGFNIEYRSKYRSKDFSGMAVVMRYGATEFPKFVAPMAVKIKQVKDYLEEKREVIERYSLIPGDEKFRPEAPMPGIAIPFMNNVIVGSVRMESIGRDAEEVKEFVEGLEGIGVKVVGVE